MSSILPIIISFSSLLSVRYRITNRKRRSLTPYTETKKSLYVDIASQADSGRWQFTSPKILQSTERAWNKEGVPWSQKWLPYHLPEGYTGVTGVQRQRQSEINQTLGNSPRRWRRARAYINITHTLEREHKLSLSRAQHFLLETLFYPLSSEYAFMTKYCKFLSLCTMLDRSNTFFSLYKFNYLHRNLTNKCFCCVI
jgi:hypothetical protein